MWDPGLQLAFLRLEWEVKGLGTDSDAACRGRWPAPQGLLHREPRGYCEKAMGWLEKSHSGQGMGKLLDIEAHTCHPCLRLAWATQ